MTTSQKLIEKQKELIAFMQDELIYNGIEPELNTGREIKREIASLESELAKEQEPEPERMISEIEYKKAIAEISRLQKLLKLIEDSGDENI